MLGTFLAPYDVLDIFPGSAAGLDTSDELNKDLKKLSRQSMKKHIALLPSSVLPYFFFKSMSMTSSKISLDFDTWDLRQVMCEELQT